MEIIMRNFDLEDSSRNAVSTSFELPKTYSRVHLCDTGVTTRGSSVSSGDIFCGESGFVTHAHTTIQQIKRTAMPAGVDAGVNRGKPPRGRPRWEL